MNKLSSPELLDRAFGDIFRKDFQDMIFPGQYCFFGRFLGKGVYTGAIDIDYPFISGTPGLDSFKNPVLIISAEKEKPLLVKAVTGNPVLVPDLDSAREQSFLEWKEEMEAELESGEVKEEDFIWSEFASEFNLLPYIEYIKDCYGLEIFFTEKVESHAVNSLVLEVCNKFLEQEVPDRTYLSNIEEISEETWAVGEEYEQEIFDKIGLSYDSKEEVLSLWQVIARDLKKLAKTVVDNFGDKIVSMDIHDQQFANVNNKIVLLDAFVF